MSAPERYRVTLGCGCVQVEHGKLEDAAHCQHCHSREWVIAAVPLLPEPPMKKVPAPEPPGLRGWWTRLLAKLPGLETLMDRIHGPWRG